MLLPIALQDCLKQVSYRSTNSDLNNFFAFILIGCAMLTNFFPRVVCLFFFFSGVPTEFADSLKFLFFFCAQLSNV